MAKILRPSTDCLVSTISKINILEDFENSALLINNFLVKPSVKLDYYPLNRLVPYKMKQKKKLLDENML